MGCYNLFNLSASFNNNVKTDAVDYKYYKFYLESDIGFNKPDYVAVLDLKSEWPLQFYKNYNLGFLGLDNHELKDILRFVDKNQLNKIYRIDKQSVAFAYNNLDLISQAVFKLRFSVVYANGEKKSLLRNIRFIPKILNKKQHMLMVVTFSDVTNLLGVANQPMFDIKYIRSKHAFFENELENLKTQINAQLSIKQELTPRELEILVLIGEGKTSDDIAKTLKISKNTVSTHRQNLIKKFNVKNTTSLLREL
ncbi:MAG: response regulator transcription factor [Flavobacteriaceae bacterium]